VEEKLVAERLLQGVVKINFTSYRELFTKTKPEQATDPYWKSALALFAGLNQSEKETFFSILKQVAVDTVSNVAGAIDGSSDIGLKEDIRLIDRDGKPISGCLQDYFLEAVQHDS